MNGGDRTLGAMTSRQDQQEKVAQVSNQDPLVVKCTTLGRAILADVPGEVADHALCLPARLSPGIKLRIGWEESNK